MFWFHISKKKFVLKLNPEIWEHTETLLKRSRTGQETRANDQSRCKEALRLVKLILEEETKGTVK